MTTPALTATAKASLVLDSLMSMYYDEIEGGLYPRPRLLNDAFESQFAIAWEDGPHEWAFRLNGQPDPELAALRDEAGIPAQSNPPTGKVLDVPDGVEVIPYYSFVLCIDTSEDESS